MLAAKLDIDCASIKAKDNVAQKRAKRLARGKRVCKVKVASDFKVVSDLYAFLYFEKYKQSTPLWGGREAGNCKVLIKKLGVDRAEKLLRYVFKNWEWVSREIGLSGAPMIGDILGRCVGYASAERTTEVSKDGFGDVARIKVDD
jgi:hypothetical protein